MKDLIVMTGLLLLLLLVPLQLVQEQIVHQKLTAIEKSMYMAKEKAKAEGIFTSEIIDSLKNKILLIDEKMTLEDIEFMATEGIRYRLYEYDERGVIHYTLKVKIKDVVHSAIFWGMDEEENSFIYEISGDTTSEKLP